MNCNLLVILCLLALVTYRSNSMEGNIELFENVKCVITNHYRSSVMRDGQSSSHLCYYQGDNFVCNVLINFDVDSFSGICTISKRNLHLINCVTVLKSNYKDLCVSIGQTKHDSRKINHMQRLHIFSYKFLKLYCRSIQYKKHNLNKNKRYKLSNDNSSSILQRHRRESDIAFMSTTKAPLMSYEVSFDKETTEASTTSQNYDHTSTVNNIASTAAQISDGSSAKPSSEIVSSPSNNSGTTAIFQVTTEGTTSQNQGQSTFSITNKDWGVTTKIQTISPANQTTETFMTTSQSNQTIGGKEGGKRSNVGVIVAAVIVPVIVITIVVIIVYKCYRRKYPVRMVIGKNFSKFSNPIYVKKTSTLTLERSVPFEDIDPEAIAHGEHDNPGLDYMHLQPSHVQINVDDSDTATEMDEAPIKMPRKKKRISVMSTESVDGQVMSAFLQEALDEVDSEKEKRNGKRTISAEASTEKKSPRTIKENKSRAQSDRDNVIVDDCEYVNVEINVSQVQINENKTKTDINESSDLEESYMMMQPDQEPITTSKKYDDIGGTNILHADNSQSAKFKGEHSDDYDMVGEETKPVREDLNVADPEIGQSVPQKIDAETDNKSKAKVAYIHYENNENMSDEGSSGAEDSYSVNGDFDPSINNVRKKSKSSESEDEDDMAKLLQYTHVNNPLIQEITHNSELIAVENEYHIPHTVAENTSPNIGEGVLVTRPPNVTHGIQAEDLLTINKDNIMESDDEYMLVNNEDEKSRELTSDSHRLKLDKMQIDQDTDTLHESNETLVNNTNGDQMRSKYDSSEQLNAEKSFVNEMSSSLSQQSTDLLISDNFPGAPNSFSSSISLQLNTTPPLPVSENTTEAINVVEDISSTNLSREIPRSESPPTPPLPKMPPPISEQHGSLSLLDSYEIMNEEPATTDIDQNGDLFELSTDFNINSSESPPTPPIPSTLPPVINSIQTDHSAEPFTLISSDAKRSPEELQSIHSMSNNSDDGEEYEVILTDESLIRVSTEQEKMLDIDSHFAVMNDKPINKESDIESDISSVTDDSDELEVLSTSVDKSASYKQTTEAVGKVIPSPKVTFYHSDSEPSGKVIKPPNITFNESDSDYEDNDDDESSQEEDAYSLKQESDSSDN